MSRQRRHFRSRNIKIAEEYFRGPIDESGERGYSGPAVQITQPRHARGLEEGHLNTEPRLPSAQARCPGEAVPAEISAEFLAIEAPRSVPPSDENGLDIHQSVAQSGRRRGIVFVRAAHVQAKGVDMPPLLDTPNRCGTARRVEVLALTVLTWRNC